MNIENMSSKLINDRLDELEIEHWKQVILHEHELEELVGHEHREYELEVDKYEEIHVVEEELLRC